MSAAAEIQAQVAQRWAAACTTYVSLCRAAGKPIAAATAQRMNFELGRIADDFEHIGRSDFEVLSLAHSRATPAGIARAARASAAVLARVKGGRHG